MTRHEVKLWNWLREGLVPLGYHFRRQVPIERFIVDFACLRRGLIVEVDGEQHGRDRDIQAADRERDQALADRGYRVLRFTNSDIDRRKAVVLDTILAALRGEWDEPHPVPSGPPSPAGEGSPAHTGRST
jgi:very-short-patch-repair endonuclease